MLVLKDKLNWSEDLTVHLVWASWKANRQNGPWASPDIKIVFSDIRIPIIKIRKSWDRLTFILGFFYTG